MALRNIVEIDESKCNGCGLCVPSCAEGAIQIIHGKARLVSDVYCDGLGACLGHCPQNAIRVIQRDAADFDEEAARHHVQAVQSRPLASARQLPSRPSGHGACPGSAVHNLLNLLPSKAASATRPASSEEGLRTSGLANWPVQLHLVPPQAPFLREADLLLVADCVPFAYPDFHARLLRRRPVVIGCPKLDDGGAYVQKLAAIIQQASIRSLTVVHMEVPCCTGLVRIAESALRLSGQSIPLEDVTISIDGRALANDSAVCR